MTVHLETGVETNNTDDMLSSPDELHNDCSFRDRRRDKQYRRPAIFSRRTSIMTVHLETGVETDNTEDLLSSPDELL